MTGISFELGRGKGREGKGRDGKGIVNLTLRILGRGGLWLSLVNFVTLTIFTNIEEKKQSILALRKAMHTNLDMKLF